MILAISILSVISLGITPIVFADEIDEIYDDPDHEDVYVLVDEETDESVEIKSGITHYENKNSSEVDNEEGERGWLNRASINDVLKAEITPGSGNVAQEKPRLKVILNLPQGAKSGEKYLVNINLPFIFPSMSAFELKSSDGLVFAVIEAIPTANPSIPENLINSQVMIELTDSVDDREGITGWFEISLATYNNRVEKTEPIVVKSEGKEIGRSSGSWTVPAEGKQTPTVAVNPYASTNTVGIQPYLRFAPNAIVGDDLHIIFTDLSNGLTPSCGARIESRWANANGWVVSSEIMGIDDMTVKSCSKTKVEYVISKNKLISFMSKSGLSASDLVTFRATFYADKELTDYSVTITAHSLSYGNVQGRLTTKTGLKPNVDVGALSLDTKKTVDKSSVVVGDVLNYTVTVTPGKDNNNAILDLTTIDTLPDNLEFVSASNSGKYDAKTRNITWGPRILTSTGKFTYTVKAKVISIPKTLKITNKVTNTSSTVCSGGDNISVCEDNASVDVILPQFEFVKSSSLLDKGNGYDGISAGDTIQYSFKIKNTGSAPITTAKLTDSLLGIKNYECLAGTLDPGKSVDCKGGPFEKVVSKNDLTTGSVNNKATLCLDPMYGLDCKPGEVTNKLVNPSFKFEKHSEIKTFNPTNGYDGIVAGDTINYWFSVTNTGDVDLKNVTVDDDLLGLKNAKCVDELPVGATDVKCQVTKAYTVTKADQKAGKVVNHAVGKVPGLPDQPSEVTRPVVNPSFQFQKHSEMKPVNPNNGYDGIVAGDSIDYWFSVTNTGDVPLRNVTIDDDLLGLKGAKCVDVLPVGSANVKCETTANYVVTKADQKIGEVINHALGKVPGLPDQPGETVTGIVTPGFKIEKQSVSVPANPDNGYDGIVAGDTINYKFLVSNTGDVALKNITIDDDLLGLKGAKCVDSLPAGASNWECETTASYKVTEADQEAGKVTNHAVGKVPGLPDEPGKVVTPVVNPGFKFQKHSEIKPVNPDNGYDGIVAGDSIDYWFSVTNTGDVDLRDIVIEDELLGLSDVKCVDELPVGSTDVKCETTASYKVTEADQEVGEVINHAVGKVPGLPDEPGETVTPVVNPGFKFQKHSEIKPVNPDNGYDGIVAGDSIDYWFSVTNTGDVDLRDIVIEDELLGLSDVKCVDELPVGSTDVKCETTASYKVTEADQEAGKVTNHAVGKVPGLPDEPGETVTPVVNPGFKFIKKIVNDVDNGNLVAGDLISYGFTVTNTGNVALTEVLISDTKLGVNGVKCLMEGEVIEPGTSVDCVDNDSYKYKVTEADVNAGKVYNIATASVKGLPEVNSEVTVITKPLPSDNPDNSGNEVSGITKMLAKTGSSFMGLLLITLIVGSTGVYLIYRTKKN